MADINLERKGPNIWPFLIGAIVIGLLSWGLIRMFDRDEDWRIDAPTDVTETHRDGQTTAPGSGPNR
ncbi:hypothetical protein BH23GEM3_BH23GEM3_20880 [soil metagenome]|nr:hypothetical protein [Gemmatimonadota bacterium]